MCLLKSTCSSSDGFMDMRERWSDFRFVNLSADLICLYGLGSHVTAPPGGDLDSHCSVQVLPLHCRC